MKATLRLRILLVSVGIIMALAGCFCGALGVNWPLCYLGATALLLAAVPLGEEERRS